MNLSNLQSMTGYAEFEGVAGETGWRWEMRSVNGKSLDVRLRLPHGYERLEQEIRKAISTKLKRGNVQAVLHLERDKTDLVPVINDEVLDAVLVAAEKVSKRFDTSPPSVDGILSLRGVLEMNERDIEPDALAELDATILGGLGTVLDLMQKSRGKEGAALGAVLEDNLNMIAALTKKAEENKSRSPEIIRSRLQEQLALLLEASSELNPDRLHQEAALLATKADIREELDRLYAHVDAARDLLSTDGPVGRKLDFIAQEFNREANTLCSKSNASEMTAIGLELKVVIDQFREQIQNLE